VRSSVLGDRLVMVVAAEECVVCSRRILYRVHFSGVKTGMNITDRLHGTAHVEGMVVGMLARRASGVKMWRYQ